MQHHYTVCDAAVSMFRHAQDSTPQTHVPLRTVLDAIRQGTYRLQVEAVRGIYQVGSLAAYAAAKRQLPGFTPCGTFTPTRRRNHLHTHSGISNGDIDDVDDVTAIKALYAADPCCVFAFTSPSGRGVKVGIRVAPVTSDAAYQCAWQVVAASYSARYGVPWDPSGKDSCRLCFLSHDPQLFLNPCPEIFHIPLPPPTTPTVAWTTPTAPQTSAPSLARRSAEHVLAVAVRWIAQSQPGGRHNARCKASYLVGGAVGPWLPYEEAYATLEAAVLANTTTPEASLKTVQECLASGAGKPFAMPQVDAAEAAILGLGDDGLLPSVVLNQAEAERYTTGPPMPRRAVPRLQTRLSGRLSHRITRRGL